MTHRIPRPKRSLNNKTRNKEPRNKEQDLDKNQKALRMGGVSGSFLFDKELIEKAKTADKPYYAIGVDTYDKDNLAYCLTRKIGDKVEVLLSKVSREETEFKQEVENLAKYFNADVFKSGD